MSLKLDNYNERKGEFEGRGGDLVLQYYFAVSYVCGVFYTLYLTYVVFKNDRKLISFESTHLFFLHM